MGNDEKAECGRVLRHLYHVLRKESGLSDSSADRLSFTQFFSWVEQKYSSYLNFRTTTFVRFDVEMWFDQEFKQA
jgi:hypothetical protein